MILSLSAIQVAFFAKEKGSWLEEGPVIQPYLCILILQLGKLTSSPATVQGEILLLILELQSRNFSQEKISWFIWLSDSLLKAKFTSYHFIMFLKK